MAKEWEERVSSKLQVDEELLHVSDVQPLQNPICKCLVALSMWHKLSIAAGGKLTAATWALKGDSYALGAIQGQWRLESSFYLVGF